ncbi:MAG TPA: hypothetical protein VLA89_04350 [Gemmatimonadales bacterium]|nr:hypothetical protein [Gemmatimonadales bacterium]
MSESDLLSVVGKNDGIKEKQQGWYEVEVSVPGKKYPVRLSTKSTKILDEVRAVGSDVATFYYKESESSKENPNTGKPYINRYLESVTPGAVAGAGGGNAGGSERMTKEEWNAKDRRDFRSRAWAQTISAFAHTVTPDDDPVLVFAKLKPFQRKLYEDIVGDLDPKPEGQQPQTQQTLDDPGRSDEPPPPTDDDIPF